MTIDDAIYLEEALDMQARGMTKDQFVGCVMDCAKARELESARRDYFPS